MAQHIDKLIELTRSIGNSGYVIDFTFALMVLAVVVYGWIFYNFAKEKK
jgi:hypothetical protein